MNTYEKLAAALEKNAYKKGEYKGDAPADPSRRSRSHIRVVKRSKTMCVRMYSTDILTAHPDGRFMIDLGGWETSPTTREAINEALREYRGSGVPYMDIRSVKVFGLSQICVTVGDKTYRYTSCMEFDETGNLTTEPEYFEALRMDTEASKEFMAEIKASGFKDMFPLLYATATPTTAYDGRRAPSLRSCLGNDYHANEWPEIVAAAKYRIQLAWDSATQRRTNTCVEIGDAQSCWKSIMSRAKSDLTRVVKSTTTEVIMGQRPKFTPIPRPL